MAEDKTDIDLQVDAGMLEGRTDEQIAVLKAAAALPNQNIRIDRKVNMGNYESLGIGVSVNMPIGLSDDMKPVYNDMQQEALKDAYKFAAEEINGRVDRIKARIAGESK